MPLATIGGVVALYLSGQYLSVPSSVGFITLFGVVVLNDVVMVKSINLEIKRQAQHFFDKMTDTVYPHYIHGFLK